ncbi:MAG: heme-binding domain-containing protein [Myxococcales bacterium]|nr:heme-binding domain-containing protein [Myxococcales bacterium]
MRRGKLVKVFGALFGALLVLQLVPASRTNPPVTQDLEAPPAVKALLKRACYDCHSNESVWPWYARVAPASFLVSHDVKEGREHLNFSEWDRVAAEKQPRKLKKAAASLKDGKMPLPIYLPLHPEARLTPEERDTLTAWLSRPR